MRRIVAIAAVLTLTGALQGPVSATGGLPERIDPNSGVAVLGESLATARVPSHPQSGDNWELVGCSSPTGTCSYPQTGTATITMYNPLLPPMWCAYYAPPLYTCGLWMDQWTFTWYSPAGSQLVPSSCIALYDSGSGLKVGTRCSLPISGRPPGEYRGELCRVIGYSQACAEVLLDVYFNVAAPGMEMSFSSIGANDGWVRERDEDSGKGSILNSGNTTGRVGDDALDRQFRSILDFDTSGLPDDAVVTGATLRIRRAGVTGTNPLGTHGFLKVDMVAGSYHDNPALERLDFHAVGSRGNVGRFIKTATDRWYRAPLRSPALPLINLTGHTQFRLRFELDDNDDLAPDYLSFYSGDATAANRPELIVTYYVP